MATVSSKRPIRKRLILSYAFMALIAIAAIWLLFNFSTLKGNARVGSAYAAHITCSCRYIQGRSLDDCAKDKEAGMEIVSISDDPDNKRITASVPFLAEAAAEKRGEFGCLPLTSEEMEAIN